MTQLPLGRADYHRTVPKEARIQTRNRYFEQNPVLVDPQNGTALISRPAMRRWLAVGAGPIRGVYSQPGSFSDALFVVSGNEWYRVDIDGTVTFLIGNLNPGGGSVSMAGTGTIGATPEFMFLADGRNLFVYLENGFAQGFLSGSPANNDVVEIGGIYYKFTNASVDAGAPAGTIANPWLVKLGGVDSASYENLSLAIGAAGDPGTDYSTALTAANPQAAVQTVSGSSIVIRATAVGATGNGVTTTETGAGMAWADPTLTGGGAPTVNQVSTPDDVGIIAVAYSSSYVICVPAQGEGINGRFFWIEPGETTIDPLDFATAEREPDAVLGVVAFGDQYWLPGTGTNEVWYFTGNPDTPTLRLQGVTFNRGTWEGTALQVKESMITVDSDGGVFQIAGGLKRISNPGIEQEIREAQQFQASRILY